MKIVILDGKSLEMDGASPWGELEGLGECTVYSETAPEKTIERSAGADILVVNKVVLSRATLEALPGLKCIAVTAAGTNVVDSAAAAERGIPVCNTPAYGTDAVAQHVFALLLELCRRTGMHDVSVKNGEWDASRGFSYWLAPQIDLAGKTMGIFRYGNLGKKVAEIAHAFGMKVVACSHRPQPEPGFGPFAFVSAEELFRESDVISLNCSLNDETHYLVRRENIALMKPGVLVINTCRGAVVNSADAAAALREGALGGLGTDVLESEPPAPDDPLLTAPNTVITPHLAWATDSARRRIVEMTVANIRSFMAGSPTNVVNPGYARQA